MVSRINNLNAYGLGGSRFLAPHAPAPVEHHPKTSQKNRFQNFAQRLKPG